MPVTSDFLMSSVSDNELAKAAEVVRMGGIVAFPTETFYGLAVDPLNEEALERLFQLKERSYDSPFLVLIDRIDKLPQLVKGTPELYRKIIEDFWPGPITLIFDGQEELPVLLTDANGTIGVRLSSHPVARRLAAAVGGIITGTSANPSGQPAAISSSQVKEMFPVGVDFVINGGVVPGGPGSTIIGIDGSGLKLIRDGSIPFCEIIAEPAKDK
jgi:L-threonylcarbamoyladenylate synthase